MQNKSRIAPQQLIDQHKEFNLQAITNIANYLPTVEKEYCSVAIIGVQNSGKSTLLNSLFGTNFDVLHTIMGTRTTRGILVSLDKQQNILVMDVEGNDAKDRANQQQYQKMVSTFALVSADVLIINVWAKTIGQYTGTQYETLNAILDVCISQFKQQSPKTILFCVRDFNEEVDQEGQIRRKLLQDVTKIWNACQKPVELEKYKQLPDKFFTVEVAVFRKFKAQNPKNFLKDVSNLRERFIDPKVDGYIFKSKKHSFNMPLKDIPQLLFNSWESIITNKKLNLPNEKEQLSNFRCSQIHNEIYSSFKKQLQKIQNQLKVVDFKVIYEHYASEFEKQTYSYGKKIVQAKQLDLKNQMDNIIKRVIEQILQCQQKKLKQAFRTNSGYVNQQNSKTLIKALNKLKDQAVEKFASIFRQLNYQINQNNQSNEVDKRKLKIAKFTSFLQEQNKSTVKKSLEIINAQFQKQCSRSIRLLSSEVLKNHFGKDFWTHVDAQYKEKRRILVNNYEKKILWGEDKVVTAQEIDLIDEKLSDQLKKTIRAELQKSLMEKAYNLFSNKFMKDKDGIEYNFNILLEAKICELYERARQQARQLVTLINQYNVKRSKTSTILQYEEDEEDEFFEPVWLSNALNQLDKKMIAEHETIIRRKKQSQMKKVPIWLFVVIIFFVYDDVWFPGHQYPITNGLLTLILVFVAFFFSIGQQSAFMQLWNLLLQSGTHGVGYLMKLFKK